MDSKYRVKRITTPEPKSNKLYVKLFEELHKKRMNEMKERYARWLEEEDYNMYLGDEYIDKYVTNKDKIMILNDNINSMLKANGYNINDKKGFRNELGSIIYRLSRV